MKIQIVVGFMRLKKYVKNEKKTLPYNLRNFNVIDVIYRTKLLTWDIGKIFGGIPQMN